MFQEAYAKAFADASRVLIRATLPLDDLPPDRQFSSQKLAETLRRQGQDASAFADTESIIDELAATSRSGDKIIILSNGGFDNIHARLLERLQAGA